MEHHSFVVPRQQRYRPPCETFSRVLRGTGDRHSSFGSTDSGALTLVYTAASEINDSFLYSRGGSGMLLLWIAQYDLFLIP